MFFPRMSSLLKASLLFTLLVICGAAFILAHRVTEQAAPPAPHELFTIVNQQLLAFRSADFRSAYRQAASGVQQKFTIPQFEQMVRHNYPEMTRSHRVEFGFVRVEGGSAVVQVYFFARNGSVRSFLYSLTNENNSWKIDGVKQLKGFRPADRLAGSSV